MKRNMFRHWAQTLVACAAVYVSQASLHAQGEAPGVPGAALNWETGNKQGLGTATSIDSKVWYTLSNGVLSEVYYPSGDTANVRSLEFAVTDGATFVDRESDDTTQQVQLVDNNSLIYRQIKHGEVGPLPDYQNLCYRPQKSHGASACQRSRLPHHSTAPWPHRVP
jgi:Glucodextranase, domain N